VGDDVLDIVAAPFMAGLADELPVMSGRNTQEPDHFVEGVQTPPLVSQIVFDVPLNAAFEQVPNRLLLWISADSDQASGLIPNTIIDVRTAVSSTNVENAFGTNCTERPFNMSAPRMSW